MKFIFTFIVVNFIHYATFSQTAITAVTTITSTASGSFTYSNAGNTYNWGLAPNNTEVSVSGFTAGGVGYTYASFLTGNVKLRRVDNANVSGNFSLIWAQATTSGTTFNMFPAYQNDMEAFFNNRAYIKGTDNFFDNTSTNSNNIERLDWILTGSYSVADPSKVGFAVFERGAVGAHDPFCIAAITSLDGLGNPATYSNIVRVASANYASPGPNVTYRILKGLVPANLLDAGTNTQSRGGVIISLANLGIAANQPVYGYSLFSNDLPIGATPANLVDFTNTTFFPINTGNPGGIDLIAVTGIYVENSILPVKFISFQAIENNDNVNLTWRVENEVSVNKYEVERSVDGIRFMKVGEIPYQPSLTNSNNYSFSNNVSSILSNIVYYRIKQYDIDNSFYYSMTLAIRRHNNSSSLLVYPNPVQNTLYLNIASRSTNVATISIYNSLGLLVLFQNENIAPGNNSILINEVNKLPKGNYILHLKLDNGKAFTEIFSKQ